MTLTHFSATFEAAHSPCRCANPEPKFRSYSADWQCSRCRGLVDPSRRGVDRGISADAQAPSTCPRTPSPPTERPLSSSVGERSPCGTIAEHPDLKPVTPARPGAATNPPAARGRHDGITAKSARIAVQGRVNYLGYERFDVLGDSDTIWTCTPLGNGSWSCTCPAGEYGRVCAHVVAAVHHAAYALTASPTCACCGRPIDYPHARSIRVRRNGVQGLGPVCHGVGCDVEIYVS